MKACNTSRFTCRAQVDAFNAHLLNNETLFWQTYWKVMLYLPPNCNPKHARVMTTNEAKLAIKFGSMRINDLGSKNLIDTIALSPELRSQLKVAIELAGNRDTLFDSSLTESNRAKNMGVPVSRQASYKVISRAQKCVQDASRDAGISEEFNLHQRTIMWYDTTSTKTSEILNDLVQLHGRYLSSEFCSNLRSELDALNKRIDMGA